MSAAGNTMHTPGPWRADHKPITRPGGGALDHWIIRGVYNAPVASTEHHVHAAANARMIAAAPCMLEALLEARIALATDCDEARWIASNVVETAIAKAEGRHA